MRPLYNLWRAQRRRVWVSWLARGPVVSRLACWKRARTSRSVTPHPTRADAREGEGNRRGAQTGHTYILHMRASHTRHPPGHGNALKHGLPIWGPPCPSSPSPSPRGCAPPGRRRPSSSSEICARRTPEQAEAHRTGHRDAHAHALHVTTRTHAPQLAMEESRLVREQHARGSCTRARRFHTCCHSLGTSASVNILEWPVRASPASMYVVRSPWMRWPKWAASIGQ